MINFKNNNLNYFVGDLEDSDIESYMAMPEEGEDVTTKKTDVEKKEFSNNPECLLVIKKNTKISRNEKCPATGKKYKHCCGAL